MIGPRTRVLDDPLAELESAWARSDALFEFLGRERLHSRPIGLRHPCLFYLGHLPAFAWNQLGRGVLGRAAVDPHLDVLFERGIDPEDEAEAEAQSIGHWPEVEDVLVYRDRVRTRIRDAVGALSACKGDPLAVGSRVLWLIIEHERMHHETLLYMFQELPEHPWPGGLSDGPGRSSRPVPVGGGPVTLGADFAAIRFGWDNEFPEALEQVADFWIDDLPVRNLDLLPFVEESWAQDRWWRAQDRDWRGEGPATWRRTRQGWEVRALGQWVPLHRAQGWPAQVSYAAARAFCGWSGARLPTEAELHRAAFTTPDGGTRIYPWGSEHPTEAHGNFDFSHGGPVPTGSHPAGASAWGVQELVGNGWEWTDTVFAPREGFEAWVRTYPGYSADFFDGAHRVVFGASWATDRIFLRRSFRNWYQERYPYVFSSFRRVWQDR